jgi:hypothetical protein
MIMMADWCWLHHLLLGKADSDVGDQQQLFSLSAADKSTSYNHPILHSLFTFKCHATRASYGFVMNG